MALVFDIFVGRYAPLVSGVCGLCGSLALAWAPIATARLREVFLQFGEIDSKVDPKARDDARGALTREARQLLAVEKRINLAGAVFLVAAFAILIANSIYASS